MLITLVRWKDFFEISLNERGQEAVNGNYINSFSEKILIWSKWANLGPKMAHLHSSGSTLRIILKLCTTKGAKRYMELKLMIFLRNSHLGQMG